MTFKINIAEKTGKTYKLESEGEALISKELHDKIQGNDISKDLEGYEFEITGASDKAGFPSLEIIQGIGLKKVLLSYEKGMKKRPKKEGKIKRSKNRPKGLRLRKTARGKVISEDIVQINLKLLKEGSKKLSVIFPEQNKSAETEVKKEEVQANENIQKKQESAGTQNKEDKKPVEKEAAKEEKKEETEPKNKEEKKE